MATLSVDQPQQHLSADHSVNNAQDHSLRDATQRAVEKYIHELGGKPMEMYKLVMKEVEVPLLKVIMKHTGNNQSRAAIVLGISRGTLRKKIKEYGID
ncbi:MAG: helix-turn-helix domain-containing protein [Pseudomonadota bacterium]